MSALSAESIIHILYPWQRGKTSFPIKKRGCCEYGPKPSLSVRLQFWNSVECGVTSLLPLLPGPFGNSVIVPINVPSMSNKTV